MLKYRLICHEYFHVSNFHDLEKKIHILALSISRVIQVEDDMSRLQERLSPSKNMVEKEESSHYSSSHQHGECLGVVEEKKTLDE
jgi:hypothetical protein